MLRRVGLAVALVLGSVVLAIGDQSAKAQDVCVGSARLLTQAPLFWPLVGPPTGGQFVIQPNSGLCAGAPLPQMQGFYSGDCLTIQLSGVTQYGDTFNAAGLGGLLFFTGGVNGMAHMWADPAAGQSCFTGAVQFLLEFAAVTNSGPGPTIPPIGPLPTIPPLPGGPAVYSDDCTGAIPVRTTVEGEDVKLIVETSGSTVTVCVRVGTATGLGGKLVITTPSGLPDVPALPQTDGDVDACAGSGNQIPGSHPIIEGPGPVPHLVDAYVGSAGVMACLSLNGTDLRVVVPIPGVPSLGGADADWYPDPGTPG